VKTNQSYKIWANKTEGEMSWLYE